MSLSQRNCLSRRYTTVRQQRLEHWPLCPEGNTALCAERWSRSCAPLPASGGHKGTGGARGQAALFRASGDHYATVWAQQVRHDDNGPLRGGGSQGYFYSRHQCHRQGRHGCSIILHTGDVKGWKKSPDWTTVKVECLRSGAAMKEKDCQP